MVANIPVCETKKTMNKPTIIIAIDPDATKSGIAILNTKEMTLKVQTLSFPELIDVIDNTLLLPCAEGDTHVILVEAGWLNESNWHLKRGESAQVAATKGKHVGMNQQTGKLIIEMLKYGCYNVEEIRPLKKCWKGKDGKITHEELSYFIPNLPKRTNQEERDAVLLAWNYVGYPIRVKPINSQK